MSFDWWTFGLETVNFLILMIILHRLLYKPVREAIARRQAAMARDLDAASQVRAQAEEVLAGYEAKLAGFADERATRLAEDREAIQDERRQLLEQTRAESDELSHAVRDQLSRERREAMVDVRKHAASLAITMARKLLGEVSDESATQRLFERACKHLASLSPEERAHMTRPRDAQASVVVVTPVPLGDRQQDRWRERLIAILASFSEEPQADNQARGPAAQLEIAFETDESLIAGVEFRFSGAVMRFAWEDALQAAEKVFVRDADTA